MYAMLFSNTSVLAWVRFPVPPLCGITTEWLNSTARTNFLVYFSNASEASNALFTTLNAPSSGQFGRALQGQRGFEFAFEGSYRSQYFHCPMLTVYR